MIKITIDSNLINLRNSIKEMNKIEELNEQGKIQIVGAQRLYDEMKEYNKDAFSKAEKYENISEPFTIGYSAIGSAYIAGEYNIPSFQTFASILFPNQDIDLLSRNQTNDIMHLIAHAHSDSDFFITNNTVDFIDAKRTNKNRGQELKNHKRYQLRDIHIIVMTPKEFLEYYENN
jgi:predicted nucleic acid-binding protein